MLYVYKSEVRVADVMTSKTVASIWQLKIVGSLEAAGSKAEGSIHGDQGWLRSGESARLAPTNVAQVRFPDPVSYVG